MPIDFVSPVWIHPSGATLWVGGDDYIPGDLEPSAVRTILSLAEAPGWVATDPTLAQREFLIDDLPVLPDPGPEGAAVRFVRDALGYGQPVLVHCSMGLNRSAYLAARVMVAEGLTPGAAVRLLLSRRDSDCLFNTVFATAILGRPVPQAWRDEAAAREAAAREAVELPAAW